MQDELLPSPTKSLKVLPSRAPPPTLCRSAVATASTTVCSTSPASPRPPTATSRTPRAPPTTARPPDATTPEAPPAASSLPLPPLATSPSSSLTSLARPVSSISLRWTLMLPALVPTPSPPVALPARLLSRSTTTTTSATSPSSPTAPTVASTTATANASASMATAASLARSRRLSSKAPLLYLLSLLGACCSRVC